MCACKLFPGGAASNLKFAIFRYFALLMHLGSKLWSFEGKNFSLLRVFFFHSIGWLKSVAENRFACANLIINSNAKLLQFQLQRKLVGGRRKCKGTSVDSSGLNVELSIETIAFTLLQAIAGEGGENWVANLRPPLVKQKQKRAES